MTGVKRLRGKLGENVLNLRKKRTDGKRKV